MSFPMMGKFFLSAPGEGFPPNGRAFAQEIAAALNRASVESAVHVKAVAGWTGANERTVKNWFAGTYGPNGEHLLSLGRHCDQVLDAMIVMMGRRELLVGHRVADIERRVRDLADALDGLKIE
ncbi:hypothetical protein J2W51_000112 [Tardiphaga robiniae]|uniref:hypothetical protein n=1 Tax=Tardiphaga robiniae TaxID=943830 RepID=UPI00285D57C8|nr:hypothetical protein [Tardiphaga robiniae]MDR6657570.1 hypothetical protein [Tardiphaga robiniae]